MCIKEQIYDLRKSLLHSLVKDTTVNSVTSVICLSVVLRKLFQINGPL